MIPPGSTVGVLGGGQLGRMFAMAARRLGYRVHTLAPDHDTPTGQIADVEINASYDDMDAVRAFARAVDVVTFEFENVSAASDQGEVVSGRAWPAGRAVRAGSRRGGSRHGDRGGRLSVRAQDRDVRL
jgi:5-(carboxyamino)imidazole ribonucleotide synthase